MFDSIFITPNAGIPLSPDEFRRLSTVGYPNLIRINNGLPPIVQSMQPEAIQISSPIGTGQDIGKKLRRAIARKQIYGL